MGWDDAVYGRAKHRRVRAVLRNLPCWRCGAAPPSTVGHIPPLCTFPRGQWVGEYRPECKACNYGEGGRLAHSDVLSDWWS